jgi:uncharacterized protein (TIGR03083 family)
MLPSSGVRTDTDTGQLYEASRQQLIETMRSASAEELERHVAATPAWRVRDVLSHVVGVTADLNAGRFGVGDPDAWTRNQVASRRDVSIEGVIAEWDRESVTFEEGLMLLGYSIGSHYVGDLFTHRQDVRATLGVPRTDELMTVLVALDFYLESLDQELRASGVGAVRIVVADEQHVAGPGAPIATFAGPPYDVLRALSGRRSVDQIRGFDWQGDVERMAPLLSRYPLPTDDILD